MLSLILKYIMQTYWEIPYWDIKVDLESYTIALPLWL